MNILIIGGGGREHTIAWKLAQSPNCGKLFVAPGNAGTHEIATNLSLGVTDFEGIKQAVLDNSVGMVIVGPEDPLVMGIHDFFLNDQTIKHVKVIGPQKKAAELEGSKEFAKRAGELATIRIYEKTKHELHNDNVSSKISIGKGFKTPDYRQLYFNFSNSSSMDFNFSMAALMSEVAKY